MITRDDNKRNNRVSNKSITNKAKSKVIQDIIEDAKDGVLKDKNRDAAKKL